MDHRRSVIALAVAALALSPGASHAMPIPLSFTQGSGQVTPRVFVDRSVPIRTTVGKLFVIALQANHTTGYEWSYVTSPNATIGYVGLAYQAPATGLMGSGGQEIWIFKAAQPGAVNLTFRYTRPFEPSTQTNARQVTFHVRVTPK